MIPKEKHKTDLGYLNGIECNSPIKKLDMYASKFETGQSSVIKLFPSTYTTDTHEKSSKQSKEFK